MRSRTICLERQLPPEPMPKQIGGVGPLSTTRTPTFMPPLCDCCPISARQSNCEFSVLADLAVDTDRAAVLLGDDVPGNHALTFWREAYDGEIPKTGARPPSCQPQDVCGVQGKNGAVELGAG